MKKTLFQKVLCLILSVTTLLGIFAFTASASEGKRGTNRDTASSLADMNELVGVSSYEQYLAGFAGEAENKGCDVIEIDVVNDRELSESNSFTVAEAREIEAKLNNGAKLSELSEKEQEIYKAIGSSIGWENLGEDTDEYLYLPATGETTWNFRVDDGAATFYYIRIEYYSCEASTSSISTIERKLLIDGSAPFKEASYVNFSKTWVFDYVIEGEPVPTTEANRTDVKYEYRTVTINGKQREAYCKVVTTVKDGYKTETLYAIPQDINENSMLPEIDPVAQWNTYYCQDSTGFTEGFLQFYLFNGPHTFTLVAEREPVVIKSIDLIPVDYTEDEQINREIGLPSYAETLAYYQQMGYTAAPNDVNNALLKIEAEFPDLVSDSAVYPTNDKTSSATYPSKPNAQVYNVIGENSYSALGQWAAYTFTVNQSGLYKFGMRYKQSALQGMYICRAIKLSGGQYGETPKAPFKEAYEAQFDYSEDWQTGYVGYRPVSYDENGNVSSIGEKIDFEFYFEAGVEYTVYLECSLGSLKDIIREAETALNNINSYYLSILQLTGSSPDANRDYQFLDIMPEVLRGLIEEAQRLMKIKATLETLCEDSGAHTATLQTVAILLNKMGQDNGVEIAENLNNLKSYLGTLGTWINDSKKGTLILDNITVAPADKSEEVLPEAKAGFFESLWFEVQSFFYSFFIDYEAMGLTEEPDENSRTVDVWLAEGRDQSNIWRTMIDAEGGFTSNTGYGVTLKLVTAGTLLPSILAGKGPDVYMGLDAGSTINYAIREAVLGVNGKDTHMNKDMNAVFTHYIYRDENNVYHYEPTPVNKAGWMLVSEPYDVVEGNNYVEAATNTLSLGGVSYGVPQTMNFAMMFYRMDVLAELGEEVPETWDDLLSVLPTLQSNNMQIGVNYILALDFMIYQQGGSMWKYEESDKWAGARIDLDSPIALSSFDFVCRLFTDYSFPVQFDASNRFRTGEMPIVIGDYIGTYNTLTVYATEIEGMWEFCPLPGSKVTDEKGNEYINYDSLASVTAAIILNGAKKTSELRADGTTRYPDLEAAWAYLQWQTSADVQANYGNKMVALIGPSAKYQAANKNAIANLSWTASEREAIEDQMEHLSSIVNYPGSYIMSRYMKFAFLEAVDEKTPPTEALSQYITTMNEEITRKRAEFGLATLGTNDPDPI